MGRKATVFTLPLHWGQGKYPTPTPTPTLPYPTLPYPTPLYPTQPYPCMRSWWCVVCGVVWWCGVVARGGVLTRANTQGCCRARREHLERSY